MKTTSHSELELLFSMFAISQSKPFSIRYMFNIGKSELVVETKQYLTESYTEPTKPFIELVINKFKKEYNINVNTWVYEPDTQYEHSGNIIEFKGYTYAEIKSIKLKIIEELNFVTSFVNISTPEYQSNRSYILEIKTLEDFKSFINYLKA